MVGSAPLFPYLLIGSVQRRACAYGTISNTLVDKGFFMNIRLTTEEHVTTEPGETLHAALRRAGVDLVASCGGTGSCGKCKVRVVSGKFAGVPSTRLTLRERERGMVLACQTVAETDLYLEVPKESRLVVGDRIALSRTGELAAYLRTYGAEINPLTKRIDLELPPPTLTDSISDLDRLKRALVLAGFGGIRLSHGVLATMAGVLRCADWKVSLTYVEDNEFRDEALFLTSQDDARHRYGIAVDVGTTTVVLYLVSLADGAVVDVASTYNSQIQYGDDVITRIVFAAEQSDARHGVAALQSAVISDINALLDAVTARHAIADESIDAVTLAGNTTMSHIVWGLDPASIREEPYIPTLNFFPVWKAGTLRLKVNKQAPVFTMPCVASYVGGDIVAGVLASKMHRCPETALLMDIGTNGEIAIGNEEWLVTAACSAGPCFEGSGIRCGMRATAGAIESVRIDRSSFEPAVSVIGNVHSVGICGSGMIDAIAELFQCGLLNPKGHLVEGLTSRIRKGEDGLEYLLVRSPDRQNDIVLTQCDIENLLRAKAAMYAGVTTLLAEAGFTIDAIQRVYIAGGFGSYLNIEQAIFLGMLPDLPRDRFSYLGNTSITGAYLALLAKELRNEAEAIAARMTYIELSASRLFMDEYVSALFLPHTDLSQFPSVARRLGERKA